MADVTACIIVKATTATAARTTAIVTADTPRWSLRVFPVVEITRRIVRTDILLPFYLFFWPLVTASAGSVYLTGVCEPNESVVACAQSVLWASPPQDGREHRAFSRLIHLAALRKCATLARVDPYKRISRSSWLLITRHHNSARLPVYFCVCFEAAEQIADSHSLYTVIT